MKKISIMEAIEKCASYSKVWEFIAEDNIDWSDLWIIDFTDLTRDEKYWLYTLTHNCDKREYLIRILFARYGSKFSYVFQDIMDGYYPPYVDVVIRLCEGKVIADIYQDLLPHPINYILINIPWIRESLGTPYHTVDYREDIIRLELHSGLSPVATTRRIYIA